LEKCEKAILEILESDQFDKAGFKKLRGFNYSNTKHNIDSIYYAIQAQYMDKNVENILSSHSIDEIIGFLNLLISAELAYKERNQNQHIKLTADELEEFGNLASKTALIPIEKLSKTAPPLTLRSYLDMCRVAYDAMYDNKYPADISTSYIFCDARMLSFEHEYDHGIFGAGWDSPKKFCLNFECSYHNEELEFGGLKLYIRDESARLSEGIYTSPNTFSRWTGRIYSDDWNTELMVKSIKAYIALRKKQYPIYFSNLDKVYVAAQKLVQ